MTAAIRPKSEGVLPLADDLLLVVELLGEHGHVAAVAVDHDPRPLGGVGLALVGGGEGALERADDRLEGDALLALEEAQLIDRDLHVAVLSLPVVVGRGP